jgi:MYXO-CTERM domain-containing protein
MSKCLALVILASGLSLSHAAPVVVTPRDDGLELARQIIVDDGSPVTPASRATHTIYLNKNGITLMPGMNDAREDRSSLVTSAVAIPPWAASDVLWWRTVSCLRVMFSRFDVDLVADDPGDVPHVEAVFGGTPTHLGMGPRVAGVAPFSSSCRPIQNAIVFAFTEILPDDPQIVCEVMAQEIAHAFGLDHELLPADPMTYLPFSDARSFQDEHAECGESSARPCGVPGYPACRATQNSVAVLYEQLGRAGEGDPVPPTVSITSPAPGTAVLPGFQVEADIGDDVSVRLATLSIDGVVVDRLASPPWTFTPTLVPRAGTVRLTVSATDGANERSESIDVRVEAIHHDGGSQLAGCSTSRDDAAILPVLVGLLGAWSTRRRARQRRS